MGGPKLSLAERKPEPFAPKALQKQFSLPKHKKLELDAETSVDPFAHKALRKQNSSAEIKKLELDAEDPTVCSLLQQLMDLSADEPKQRKCAGAERSADKERERAENDRREQLESLRLLRAQLASTCEALEEAQIEAQEWSEAFL